MNLRLPLRISILSVALSFGLGVVAQCEADTTIYLADFEFIPSVLTLTPGTTVAFINGQGLHNVDGTSENNPESFFLEEAEGTMEGTCMGVVTFGIPGVYEFSSSVGVQAQLGMTGTIVVDAFDLNDALGTISSCCFESGFVFQTYYPEELTGTDNYTVFVANAEAVDEALALMNLNQWDMIGFSDMPDALAYCIVPGTYLAADLSDGLTLPTILGQNLTVSSGESGLVVDQSNIVQADILAFNGVLHVIDKILVPAGYPQATVLDVIQQSPDHAVFETGIFGAYLDEYLQAQAIEAPADDPIFDDPVPGPFTVFAPTDEAIQSYASENGYDDIDDFVDSQYMDEFVERHIVVGYHPSSDLFSGQTLISESGATVDIEFTADGVEASGALVTTADLLAYNGVVHVVKSAMPLDLPPSQGTCGSWTINKVPGSDNGWGSGYLDIFVNGTLLSSETLLENEEESFAMAVNNGDEIDMKVRGYMPGGYEVVDQTGDVIFASIGQDPLGVFGLKPCGTQPICGYFTMQFTDPTQDGWFGGSVTINSDAGPLATIEFFEYDPFWPSKTFYIPAVGGELDFLVAPPFLEPLLTGYIVRDASNNVVIDQTNDFALPLNAYDVLVCDADFTSVSGPSAKTPNLTVHPNPSNGRVQLDGLQANATWEATLLGLDGRMQRRFKGVGSTPLELSRLAEGVYTLNVVVENQTNQSIRVIIQ
jgi:uncharacterized surface protein with fasciclin (FAS1) repeats